MPSRFSWARFASSVVAVSLLVLFTLQGRAHAQEVGFALNRFDPAEHGSNWFAGESLDLRGSVRPSLGLTLDWAYKPLVIYDANGNEVAAIVESQLNAHVGGALILFDRLRLGLSLPVTVVQRGEDGMLGGTTFQGVEGSGIGDVRVGLDLRLLGEYGDVATLAIGFQAHLPTGDRASYTGDGDVRLVPRLMLAGDVGMLAYSARAGVQVRMQDDDLGNVSTGSEMMFVATAGLRVADRKLLIGPELWGSTVISDSDAFFKKATTPFELILGGHYSAGDFILALGVGPGLTRGLGAPAVRILGSIEWMPQIEAPKEPEPAPAPVAAPLDRDDDGILDNDDSCPDDEGVASDDRAKHGCPPDRDGDGILDRDDACPDVPGVASDERSKNGCPSDRDGDGIIDDEDFCPDREGVRSDDPELNGCPGDRDNDDIIDPADACPDNPGPSNEDMKKHGCPVARVEKGQIKIIERIEFKTGSSTILPESYPIVEAVRALMKEHAEITRVSIEGHTDNVGKAPNNKKLSQRRAESVMKWLTQKGIERPRFEAHGFGDEQPLADNDSEEGRQTNRRVEFHIRTVNGEAVEADREDAADEGEEK